ncbi:MAG: phage tail tape measure protein, partial [Peptostreptococcaceae bacterium]
QEQLNRAISETNQVEHKNSFIDKLHKDALKLNQEFDEINKKQQAMRSLNMPDISTVSDVKSYVDYLDSAEDGLKRILTQYTKLKGVDLTTTIYGDGTEVRKITGNMEKATNELATAYKQADNELTKLIKTQQQMDLKGDTDTVALLDKQISNWKQIKSSIEDAANGVNLYDKMIEKSQSALMKNKQILDTNQSRMDFTIDVNNQNAIQKVNEFKAKTLSNLQELERKYQGTQLYDGVIREVERFKNELRSLDSYLENVENADMSKLSSEFRRIGQDVTQVKRDFNNLNKSISNGFFDDLYDSMRTFTLGNIIGDAIQNATYQMREAIVGIDNAMRDMMKVAPESFKGTSDQLKQVKNDALEVAKSVGKSTEDVIQGMSKALQTGVSNMQDALEVAKASSTFASVGDLDQGEADTYIASVMSAFGGMNNALKPVREQVQGMGQDYNNLTNFLDLANYAGNNFAISTGDVGEALKRSGSVLSNYGVTLDESVAMIVGANESIQDSAKVGTSLKTL